MKKILFIALLLLIFMLGCSHDLNRKPSRFDSGNLYLVLLVNELPKPQDVMVYDKDDNLLYERTLGVNPIMYGQQYDPNSHTMRLPGDKDKGDTWMKDPWIGYGPQMQQPKAKLPDVIKMMLPLGEYLLLVKDVDKKGYSKFKARVPASHVANSEGPLVWHLVKEVFDDY